MEIPIHNSHTEFSQLIETHSGILYKVANNYCRHIEDRPDLIQEMILQLWRSYSSFDGRVSQSTWVYKVALNVAISFYRHKKVQLENIAQMESLEVDLLAIDEVNETKSDDLHILTGFIKEFDELNRALLLLYLDGYNHQEISQVLGISVSNVATKISRLKLALTEKFAGIDT